MKCNYQVYQTAVIPANYFPLAFYTTLKQIDKGHRRALAPMVPFPVVS